MAQGWAARPPQVIQTSNLDCGPAALASLLRGLGCPASYEVLRDVCATDVDGTSIDAVEAVARAAGAEVSQLVVPAEHVTAMPQEYLPAVAVTVLPDGFTHFVVLWRRVRGRVLVMDPGVGRRWVRAAALRNELYRHDQVVPAAAWREWAGSAVFLAGLTARMRALRVPAPVARDVIAEVVADPGVAGLAGLDAAIRSREQGTSLGPVSRLRAEAAAFAAHWAEGGEAYSCAPPPDTAETAETLGAAAGPAGGAGSVVLRGAVLVHASGWSAQAAQAGLAARLALPEPGPGALLLSVVSHPRRLIAALGVSAVLVAGLSVTADVVLRTVLSPAAERAPIWPVLAVLGGAAAAVSVSVSGSLRSGRVLDLAVRARWWSAVAELPDRFTATRPVSDLAERGHLLHRVRELPVTATRAAANLGVVVGAVGAVAMLAPRTWPWLLLLVAVALAGPAVAARRVTETDLRLRTLAGGLSRFGYDAVLGAEAVQASGAGPALTGEHERSLAAWWAVQLRLIAVTSSIRGLVGVAAAVSGAAVLATAHSDTARELLIAVLVVTVADAGAQVSDGLRTIPVSRSVLARAAGPLRAATSGTRHLLPPGAARVQVRDVTVAAGSATQLESVTLDLPAGTHTAVVGASGSGKSTLLAVILGWATPSSGEVLVNDRAVAPGQVLDGVAWSAPETRLWNDTVTANIDYGADGDAAPGPDRLRAAEATAVAAAVADRPGDAGNADAMISGPGIGDGGATLSDGETQRLRFARAMGRPHAPVVVLDEPFRGLERPARRRLMRTARQRWEKATLLCAVHDVGDTHDFDQVVILDAGRVVESGPPEVLAADPGSRYTALLHADHVAPDPSWTVLTLDGDP